MPFQHQLSNRIDIFMTKSKKGKKGKEPEEESLL